MSAYYKKQTREFRAIFSNETSARIVAVSIQRAYMRAEKYANAKGITVKNVVDVIDTEK